jgi:sugar (pentulose or hexulose) kinase
MTADRARGRLQGNDVSGTTIVGVDVGTTFIKAVVYDDGLRVLGDAKVRTPWRPTASGGDADPDEIATAVLLALQGAVARAGDVRVDAVGVTGMGETGVLVDANGRPLAPAIAWHDRRGLSQAGQLAREVGAIAETSGRAASPLCSIVKWRYLADEGLDLRRVHRWHSLAEWVVRCLGGDPRSELSLASRTGALDVRRGVLNPDVVAWAGGHVEWFDELVPAGRAAGRATVGPPALHGSVLSVGGLDGYASAVGVGADDPTVGFLSCGTSGAAVRIVSEPLSDDVMRRAVAFDLTVDRWVDGEQLVILGATPCGLILQPLYDVLGPPSRGGPNASEDPELDPAALWQRAFDAVADGQVRLVRDFERVGSPVESVVAAGGWIAQPGLRDSLERRLGTRLEVVADENTAARGAAMLARSSRG